MKEISFLADEEMTLDTMTSKDYEEASGVTQPLVQGQALMNVALVAPETVKDDLNWATEQMVAIKPRDAVESMLAQQMVALNTMAMDCSKRALLDNQTFEGREMNMRHAARLMNAFANVSAALDKHRGKGQQTIVVKHQQVNVGDGGQAVIGNVQHGSGG